MTYNNSDESLVRWAVARHASAFRQVRVEEEDARQEVHLSLAKRPIPAHLSSKTRHWNIHIRVIDVLHANTVKPIASRGATGEKNRFRHMAALTPNTPHPTVGPSVVDPWIRRAVDALPPVERDVIDRLFWADDMQKDVAAAHGKSQQWVGGTRDRALRHLKEALCASA